MPIFIRRPDPPRCDNCGEHVMPYTTACRLCAARLDPLRRQRPRAPLDRVVECWRAVVRRGR
jgi:hypothetical protein